MAQAEREFISATEALSTDLEYLGVDPSEVRKAAGQLALAKVIFSNPEWYEDAACTDSENSAKFFPERGGSTKKAEEVCDSCEVSVQCLNYALKHGLTYGVWGGEGTSARRRLLKLVS